MWKQILCNLRQNSVVIAQSESVKISYLYFTLTSMSHQTS